MLSSSNGSTARYATIANTSEEQKRAKVRLPSITNIK